MSRGPSLNEVWRERQTALSNQPNPSEAERAHHGGYDPNQPRVPKGNPHGGQWTDKWPGELRKIIADVAALTAPLADRIVSDIRAGLPRVWQQYAEIGHNSRSPEVEITEDILQTLLLKVNAQVAATFTGPVRANVYGIAVHTMFGQMVRSLNLPGIGQEGVEQSFDFEGLRRYGFDGTIRTDVVLRDKARNIIAIFDVKTGNATMDRRREAKIREFTKIGPDVPIILLNAPRIPYSGR
jgi:hypothetical protein